LFVVGVAKLVKLWRQRGQKVAGPTEAELLVGGEDLEDPMTHTQASKERGDFPISIALSMFLVSTGGYVWVCHWLVPSFPLWILMAYGFLWTPLNSYISARMVGLTGSGLAVPNLKEGSFILSGYKGVDIWFAPIPLNDFGGATTIFKSLELTRTKITSIIKAELVMFPVSLICSFIFCAFLWSL